MLLRGLHIAQEPSPVDILIERGHIAAIYPAGAGPQTAAGSPDLSGLVAWPGIINAHDHLEFNCYPPLRRRSYQNYLDWSADLHQQYPEIIKRVEAIPREARVQYGILKNLLNGCTTVIDHGAAPARSPLLHIAGGYRYLHSLRLHRKWKQQLALSRRGLPFMVHLHEGFGRKVENDLKRLRRWNIRRHPIIGVHGISLDPAEADYLAGLIWCPGSNDFLYGKTAPVDALFDRLPLLFGTDSTLSGPWVMAEHFATARKHSQLSDAQLVQILYDGPARLFPALGSRNHIAPGQVADLVIYRPPAGSHTLSPLDAHPEDIAMVLCAGKPVLMEQTLLSNLPEERRADYFGIEVGSYSRLVAKEIDKALLAALQPIADLLPISIQAID